MAVYGTERAAYEGALARAHRALWEASLHSFNAGDEGAATDCEQLQREVSRLAEASLKGNLRRPVSRQVPLRP
jgi:hypothetical protein